MLLTRLALVLVTVIAVACGGSSPSPTTPTTTTAASEKTLVNVDAAGVALHGHDAVAYVADSATVKGTSEHASSHGGATYWFASAEYKATFEADPAKYAPRFGGYCAYAAAQNRLSNTQPDQFKVQDGYLLLFTNAEFHQLFDKDPPGNLAAADKNWPGLVVKHGK
ncbi:MAG: YHS domain-containing protein [Deltaproteobacteria bacterium]|nr:YHS domain-containing protein [Deltaproteobacteria bacterium]